MGQVHFKTEGIKNLTAEEAEILAGKDPDSHQRDVREAIERGEFPSWTVQVQIMPEDEAATYRFNPFDLTKVWPHEDYPPIEIGRLELNRNPDNIFAEVEQSIFSPAHFVPGIGPSPDRMLQGRLFASGDAHHYRVGINADHLPVNRPHATEARTNSRDGFLYDGGHGGAKNYEPNSFGGPQQTGREGLLLGADAELQVSEFPWGKAHGPGAVGGAGAAGADRAGAALALGEPGHDQRGGGGRGRRVGAAPARVDLVLGAGDLPTVEVDVEVVPVEALFLRCWRVGLAGSGPLTVIWCSRAARSRWTREV